MPCGLAHAEPCFVAADVLNADGRARLQAAFESGWSDDRATLVSGASKGARAVCAVRAVIDSETLPLMPLEDAGTLCEAAARWTLVWLRALGGIDDGAVRSVTSVNLVHSADAPSSAWSTRCSVRSLRCWMALSIPTLRRSFHQGSGL